MLERLWLGDCGGDGNVGRALLSNSSPFTRFPNWRGGIWVIPDLAANRLLKEGTLKLGAGGYVLRTKGSGTMDGGRDDWGVSVWGVGCGMYNIDCRFLGLDKAGL